MQPPPRPFLRDGVEVYIERDLGVVTFVQIASKTRFQVACTPTLIEALAHFDGTHLASEVFDLLQQADVVVTEKDRQHLDQFIQFLAARGVVLAKDWMNGLPFDGSYLQRLERHFAYLLDLVGTPSRVAQVQTKIASARVALVGAGAVGTWLVSALLAIGVRNYTLVDPAVVEPSDLGRHEFTTTGDVGRPKVEVVEQWIRDLDPDATIRCERAVVDPGTDLDQVLGPCDVVISTADEPYVGHVNLVLGRYCVPRSIPFLMAGGFDAHLGSGGELVVPGVTPCPDCFVRHFSHELRDWKPRAHPIRDRSRGVGGLGTLSAFAASASILRLMLWWSGVDSGHTGRTELLFPAYERIRVDVPLDPQCPTCAPLQGSDHV